MLAISFLCVSYIKIVQLDTSPCSITFQKIHMSTPYINSISQRCIRLIKKYCPEVRFILPNILIPFPSIVLQIREACFLMKEKRNNKNT